MRFRWVLIYFFILSFSIIAQDHVPGAILWEDTFSDPNLNTHIWTPVEGGHGFGNGELQYYTSRIDGTDGANAYVESGKLMIEARREDYRGKQFTSARLTTKGNLTYKYGTLEARIKVPDLGNGLWPAFWLLGADIDSVGWPACGELDIMEMGSADAMREGIVNQKVTAAAHWESGDKTADYDGSIDIPMGTSHDYHVFKLTWTPSLMTAYLDGQSFWEFDISGKDEADLEEFHKPMFILLNMAVGGWNYVKITDPNDITAPMPAKMYFDWIRLSDNEWTEYYNISEHVENACFGVFTETAPVKSSLKLGTDAHLYLWENTLTPIEANPYEGKQGWSFKSNPGSWFGAGVHCSTFRDMSNYTNGQLYFHMKTKAKNSFAIGIKSADGAEKWVEMVDGKKNYGLVRDGVWHEVVIPLNLYSSIDFRKIEQIFMFNNGDQIPPSAVEVSFDNIYWVPNPDNEEVDVDG